MILTAPPNPFNMAAYVLAQADVAPDKLALSVVGGTPETWRYGALRAAVLGLGAAFLARGLARGDRILMRLGNSPDFPITYLAAIAVGLVPVPTSAQLTRVEISKIAQQVQPALVVAANGIAMPDGDWPVMAQSALAAHYSGPPAAFDMGDPNRPAYIIYTSGTAGKPRAVVHAHRAVWARRSMWDGWYGLRPDDRLLHAGAFNWTYTLGTGLMDPWAIGATALIPADGTDPAALPALLAAHDATIFAAAPGVYRRMLRATMPSLPALRHGLSAGEKLPASILLQWAAATGTTIHEAFGMSECSTFLSGSPNRPAPAGTLGYVQDGRNIALRGDAIAVHRDDIGLMLGYLDQPAETAARFDGDWFLTGDIGRADASGAIIYEGRSDDMMNAGGYRVSPVEVEDALGTHPAIGEVAAVALPVQQDTTVIAAFYTAADVIEESELAAYAATRLARYKQPRFFIHTAALPRGANNKLLRRQLRQQWETDHGQT